MDSLILQKEFTASFNISVCRAAIRKMWRFQGVIRNEINENCFEIKNIGIRQDFIVGFPQYVTVLLTEKDENTTIIQIQTSPFGTVNNNESIWQTKMEELIDTMWIELCQALETSSQPVDSPIQDTNTKFAEQLNKNKKIGIGIEKIWIGIAVVVFAIILFIVIIPNMGNSSNAGNSNNAGNGIKVTEERLVTDVLYALEGNYLYPILVIKVKNVSSVTKKVSVEVNFYADGQLLGSGQSRYVTLAPGDEAYIQAQSDKGYGFWTSYEYSYKITKWWVFNQ